MAKRLQDAEITQAATIEKQEKEDLKRAKWLNSRLKPYKSSIHLLTGRFTLKDQDLIGKLSELVVSTETYQSFEDMLKSFDREDLDALCRLVNEKFSTTMPTVDREEALWVELKRLYEPNAGDVFWKLQRYMHDLLSWKSYTNCGVHQVTSTRRHNILMLTEKDYPLTNVVLVFMLSAKLQVNEDCEMARDLMMKIFLETNQPKRKSLDTSSN
nr:hypothetical protein [Tanacetum cinerariifolium]